MNAEAAFVHAWRVGRWTVSLSVPRIVAGVVCCAAVEWSPALPERALLPNERRQYDAGLAEAKQRALEAQQGVA